MYQKTMIDKVILSLENFGKRFEKFSFEQMVGQINTNELQLNKVNSSDTEAPFLDLDLSITNAIVSSKFHDK